MLIDKADILSGQVVVITGGAQGIGGAPATAFAGAGAKVYIIALGQETIEKKVEELRTYGCDAYGVECDVTDYPALCAAMADCIKRYGRIDLLYANAGVVLERTSILESDPALWEKTIKIDMLGGYYAVRAALPYMVQNPDGGKILFTGTGRGRRASANLSGYSCAKAGQWMLVRCLAEELRECHICVNELIPGPVNTALNATENGPRANADLDKTGEINKDPEDLMDLFLFIAAQSNRTGPTGQASALNRREI